MHVEVIVATSMELMAWSLTCGQQNYFAKAAGERKKDTIYLIQKLIPTVSEISYVWSPNYNSPQGRFNPKARHDPIPVPFQGASATGP